VQLIPTKFISRENILKDILKDIFFSLRRFCSAPMLSSLKSLKKYAQGYQIWQPRQETFIPQNNILNLNVTLDFSFSISLYFSMDLDKALAICESK